MDMPGAKKCPMCRKPLFTSDDSENESEDESEEEGAEQQPGILDAEDPEVTNPPLMSANLNESSDEVDIRVQDLINAAIQGITEQLHDVRFTSDEADVN